MGQYQQPFLNLRGCVLPLEQRNSQVSVPFLVSDKGYGMLWNNPATGEVSFANNLTKWIADETDTMDYWITVAENPKKLVENYTACVGRAPVMEEDYLGLWQCKLRYRTPDEVLSVARKYKELGIKLDVIVIDFFHWPYQGDWRFDPTYWPEDKVKAMVDELHGMGTKVMISVWPSVDKRSENFYEMYEKGYRFDEITVGNMASKPDAKQIRKTLFVTDKEKDAFCKLADHGVKIISQMIPSEQREDIIEDIRKA